MIFLIPSGGRRPLPPEELVKVIEVITTSNTFNQILKAKNDQHIK